MLSDKQKKCDEPKYASEQNSDMTQILELLDRD